MGGVGADCSPKSPGGLGSQKYFSFLKGIGGQIWVASYFHEEFMDRGGVAQVYCSDATTYLDLAAESWIWGDIRSLEGFFGCYCHYL